MKTLSLFLQSISLILCVAVCTSPVFAQKKRAEDDYIRLPIPPVFTPVLQPDGKPYLIEIKELEAEFRKHSPNITKFLYNPELKSNAIIVPDGTWLVTLREAWKEMLKTTNLKPEADTWDCENYSSMLSAITTLRLWKMGYQDSMAAIGYLRVDAKKPWAGIPAAMHSLMFTYTINGIFIVEPQNGKDIKLEDYPNKQYIQEVYLF